MTDDRSLLIPHQQVIETLEAQLESAVAALRMFVGHYPTGINPELDNAWAMARMLLQELDSEEPEIEE